MYVCTWGKYNDVESANTPAAVHKVLTPPSASVAAGAPPAIAYNTQIQSLTRAFGASTTLLRPRAFLLPAFIVRSAPLVALLVRIACRRL